MTDPNETLSIAGERRREEILDLARVAARRRRRSRHTFQTAGGVTLVFLAAIYVFHRPSLAPTQFVQRPIEIPHSRAPQAGRVVITTIITQPGIAAQLALPSRPPRWERIGDDQLLQSLAQAGHQAGLISMNGQTVLLWR